MRLADLVDLRDLFQINKPALSIWRADHEPLNVVNFDAQHYWLRMESSFIFSNSFIRRNTITWRFQHFQLVKTL